MSQMPDAYSLVAVDLGPFSPAGERHFRFVEVGDRIGAKGPRARLAFCLNALLDSAGNTSGIALSAFQGAGHKGRGEKT